MTIPIGGGIQRPSFRRARNYAQESELVCGLCRARGGRRQRIDQLNFFLDVFDALREQILGDLALGGGGEDLLGGGDRGIGRGGAHVGERLRLGLGDLRLRHLGAARDEIFHPRLGLGGETFGFGLGAGDDGFGLALGLTPLALEFGEQRLRLFAAADAPRRARP